MIVSTLASTVNQYKQIFKARYSMLRAWVYILVFQILEQNVRVLNNLYPHRHLQASLPWTKSHYAIRYMQHNKTRIIGSFTSNAHSWYTLAHLEREQKTNLDSEMLNSHRLQRDWKINLCTLALKNKNKPKTVCAFRTPNTH